MLLQLLVPILINCLLDPIQMKASNVLYKTLHTHGLQTLTRIGTQYPQVNHIFLILFLKLSVILKYFNRNLKLFWGIYPI